MTRARTREYIDGPATLQSGLREFQQVQRERILRELRYTPTFSGEMTFTLKFKSGIPFAIQEGCTHHALLPPVAH